VRNGETRLALPAGWPLEGAQVAPAAYVAKSWQAKIQTQRGEGYGYLWYLTHWAGRFAACAVGFGGQMIAVFPEHDLALAMNMRVDPRARPRSWHSR
jgi:CubicO group peptidase (beta-lactamase class C family)